jgi:two-component system, chemotaxis family, chemotaxis protein CheY
MKVLIIDDSLIMRNIHKNGLKLCGVNDDDMLDAGDGQTALGIAKTQSIDLFLVDWNMPKLDGLNLLKSLRTIPDYSTTPIIMITSEAAKYNVMEAIEAGVTSYIVKPVSEKSFVEKIKKYLSN